MTPITMSKLNLTPINIVKLKAKDLIVFDLDGTLAPTKAKMDVEMAKLINRLLLVKKVAVIGGGKYGIFKIQFLQELKAPKEFLKKLFLFPASSTSFYKYHKDLRRSGRGKWKKIYALELSKEEKVKIKKVFQRVFEEINYQHPKKTYGTVIEDRGTQMTFSALGQDVVHILGKKRGVFLKEEWKRKNLRLKMQMTKLLAKYLPNLEVHAAGFTSIDITKKGIDKAYGLKQIEQHLHIPIKKMVFIGDAIFKGGNDYAVVRTGVDYMPVKDPEGTKKIIRSLLA